jgi:hypothetical protein
MAATGYTPVPGRRQLPPRVSKAVPSRRTLGGAARAGESPVGERDWSRARERKYHRARDESQRIAAWKLLYRVRHPGPNVSRLQTISHSDVGSSRDPDRRERELTDLHRALTCKSDDTPTRERPPLPACSATALQTRVPRHTEPVARPAFSWRIVALAPAGIQP